jgi:tetratricopeptide (TPR) repeat protein
MPVDVAADTQLARNEAERFERHNAEGLAHFKADRLAEAVTAFQSAIAIRRDTSALHNLGVALAKLGRLDEAVASFRETLDSDAAALTTHKNLGLALYQLGKLDEAVVHYQQAARLEPASATNHFDLGRLLFDARRFEEAAASFRECVSIDPQLWTAHYELGRCLVRLGKKEEAVGCYEDALQLKPDAADVHNNLGILLENGKKYEDAIQCFRRALRFNPRSSETHSNLGVALAGLGRLDEAVASYEEALRIAPKSAEAHNNIGNALRSLGRLSESRAHLDEAIRLMPAYAEAHNNLGITRLHLGDAAAAVELYSKALELRPEYPEARLNRALAYLVQGDMEQGWREYEARWHGNGLQKRPFAQPEWNGEPLPDGSILLYTEQGLGDTFQFIRYARQVKERIGTVILEVHPNLVNVLKGCQGISQVVPQGKPLPDFTVQCPLLSLPRILDTRLDSVPAPIPYLFPDPDRVTRWQQVLRSLPGAKIGVSWQGNREFRGDRQRSLALRYFTPLAALPDVTLVSIQKGEGSEQVNEVASGRDASGSFRPFVVQTLPGLDESGGAFVDTAAVMSQVDLVITSDTAVAHLAGALGVPVWVVLSAAADWRWLRNRDESPWYPTMRLFRQMELGNWAEVLECVATAAAGYLEERRQPAVTTPQAAGSMAESAESIYQRGLEHLKQGRWAMGEPLLGAVLRLQPEHTACRHNLGVALAKLGRPGEAVAIFDELLKQKPEMADGHNNLGLAYLDLGKPEGAEPAFQTAVRLRPQSWDFLNNLGVALCRQDRLEDAAAAHRKALVLRPKYPEAHANLGHVLRLLGRLDEALHHCDQACSLQPACGKAHNNRGLVHRDLGDQQAALTCFQRAIALDPEHAEARFNRGLAWLTQGDFARGWPEYEWRWRARGQRPRALPVPQWDGSPLQGRGILLHTEQGLGDTLQFVRYAALVQKRGGRVILEAPRELIGILTDCPGIDHLVVAGTRLPDFAVHCPLLSLPGILQTRLDNIPATIPYLAANRRRIARWKDRLQAIRGFRIGIAWRGNVAYADDRRRSLSLDYFAPLTRVPGVQVVSLQKGRGSEQIKQLGLSIHELPGLDDDGNAFMDTAAVITLVDLVISSDTAVAHLAGALGLPTWLALPYAADWRWLRGRDDSPWYPIMRLFRQERPGDWPGVFSRVIAALRELPKAKAAVASVGTVTDRSAASVATDVNSVYERGLHLIVKEQWTEGEACLRQVLQAQPERWGAYLNLGVALARQRKFQEAIQCFERYAAALPLAVEGFNNLGLAHLEMGHFEQAERAFLEATRLKPDNPDHHNNLAVCRARRNDHDGAIAAFEQALQLAPDRIATIINLASAYKNKKNFARAAELYQQAISMRGEDHDTLCSLGKAYSELGDRARSADCYCRAVTLNPKSADAQNNLGVALADLNHVEEAVHHLQQAVLLRPEHGETHRNLGIIQLMAGKFEEGWTEYEWRWRCNFRDPHAKRCPRWDGGPLEGRTILLFPEQGLGDTLQFIRYAPLVQAKGGTVVFECPRVLSSLLRNQAGVDHVVPQSSPIPRVDVAAPLLSLPYLFGTTLTTVPANVPYVHADLECVARWAHALRHLGGFKVAIAWQGSTKYAGDRQRSVPLQSFAPLADVPGVQLISLQKGVGTEQLGSTARRFVPLDLGRQIDEGDDAFVDSAAVMQLADLVITSDTSLAHLAGAMGLPVWLVLHFAGDWRWLRDRDDCPWYPTMRLFRQQEWGDWQSVFQRVAAALRERLQAR